VDRCQACKLISTSVRGEVCDIEAHFVAHSTSFEAPNSLGKR
jgi:hypothetical protein